MAHADSLSENARAAVAEKVSNLIQPVPTDARLALGVEDFAALEGSALELGESFAVYRLDSDAVQSFVDNPRDLSQLAVPTDEWHHQIRVDGIDKAFAVSHIADMSRGDLSVEHLTTSTLAQRVQRAIALIDVQAAGQPDLVVRVLDVPAYRIYAFWLIDETTGQSQILVIYSGFSTIPLKEGQVLGSKQFLEVLARIRLKEGVT